MFKRRKNSKNVEQSKCSEKQDKNVNDKGCKKSPKPAAAGKDAVEVLIHYI